MSESKEPEVTMLAEKTGRSVVVTGGARGIGLAVGQRFARAGDNVLLLDRDSSVEAAGADLARETGHDILRIRLRCDRCGGRGRDV